jgi:uncharacterized protein YPO0396
LVKLQTVFFFRSDNGQRLEQRLRGTLRNKKAAQDTLEKLDQISRLCMKASTYSCSIFSTIKTLEDSYKELEKCHKEIQFLKRNLKLQLRKNDLL